MTANTQTRQKPLAQLLFPDLQQELAVTRKFLQRVPLEHADWKPHQKSFSLEQLARHVVDFPEWGIMTLETEVVDVSAGGGAPRPKVPLDELLNKFDQDAEKFQQMLATQTDAQLEATWTLKDGDSIFIQAPRSEALRNGIISHLVHHRAHLGVYFRLLGVSVPSAYGPTADEV